MPAGTLQATRHRVDGRLLHAWEGGRRDAPVVVWVHGLALGATHVLPAAERLTDDFRVLVPDLPGFGRSARPARPLDMEGFAHALSGYLRAAGAPRAHLVGASMGCQVAAELAARRPGHVERLVLQGPTVDPAARAVAWQLLRYLRDLPWERVRILGVAVGGLVRAWPRGLLHSVRAVLSHRLEATLPAVRCPTLVLRGGRDPVTPRGWAAQVAAVLPAGELREIPGGGHGLPYSRPIETARVVASFLAGPRLQVPEDGLVVLVGVAGCGKSTFARRHFADTEIVSSDRCRALVADDPTDQDATDDAFGLLRHLVDRRLRRGRCTLVDATSTHRRDRRRLVGMARAHGRPAVAIVLDVPLAVCIERNRCRHRAVPEDVLHRQHTALRRGLPDIGSEGFAATVRLDDPDAVTRATVQRVPAAALTRAGSADTDPRLLQ